MSSVTPLQDSLFAAESEIGPDADEARVDESQAMAAMLKAHAEQVARERDEHRLAASPLAVSPPSRRAVRRRLGSG